MNRGLVAGGLLFAALAWVSVLGQLLPGTTNVASQPAADGSTATIKLIDKSRFEIDQAGEVSLRMDILNPAGSPLLGLSQDRVRVSEDGEPAAVQSFNGPGTQVLNVVLVIDISGSMSGDKLRGAQQAAFAALDELTIDRDRLGIIVFNNSFRVLQPLERLTGRVAQTTKTNIAQLRAGGGTRIGSPAIAALDLFRNSRPDGSKLLLVMTDGIDDQLVEPFRRQPAGPSEIVDRLVEDSEELGVPIFTIAFGDGGGEVDFGSGNSAATVALRTIAERCHGKYVHAPTSAELAQIFQSRVQELADEFLLVYNSPFPQPDGVPRNVEVVIESANGTLTAGDRYQIGRIISGAGGSRRSASSTSDTSTATSEQPGLVVRLGLAVLLGGLLIGALFAPRWIPAWGAFLGKPPTTTATTTGHSQAESLLTTSASQTVGQTTTPPPPPPLPLSPGTANSGALEAGTPSATAVETIDENLPAGTPSVDATPQTPPTPAENSTVPLPSATAPLGSVSLSNEGHDRSTRLPPPPPPVKRKNGPAVPNAAKQGAVPPAVPVGQSPAVKKTKPTSPGNSGLPAPPPPPPIKRQS